MEVHEINANMIIKNHGGVDGRNLKDIINEASDPDEIDLIHHSPYYSPSQMPIHSKFREGYFGVLSLNAQSIQAKFCNLEAFIALMHSQTIHFPVICIQETWLNDNSRLPLVSLNGYQTFNSNASSSTHGGLTMLMKNTMSPWLRKSKCLQYRMAYFWNWNTRKCKMKSLLGIYTNLLKITII